MAEPPTTSVRLNPLKAAIGSVGMGTGTDVDGMAAVTVCDINGTLPTGSNTPTSAGGNFAADKETRTMGTGAVAAAFADGGDKGRKTREIAAVAGIDMREAEAVAWCRGGYYLPSRPLFTADPLLHAGVYYVQEASSMFLDTVLRQYCGGSDIALLDLCAAPGGKSTLARAALTAGSLVVSNEPVRQRAAVLSENMQKWGHPGVIVTCNHAADFSRAGMMFDVVMTDVPCSGEGMFRKDPTAARLWSPRVAEQCRHLQRSIVRDVWQSLKPGGLLIYSTCTFNSGEDEDNAMFIARELGADILPVDIDGAWNITGSLSNDCPEHVYRFIPGTARGEGLFMAVMRKHGGCAREAVRRRPRPSSIASIPPWLTCEDREMTITRTGDTLTAMPSRWQPTLDTARQRLHVVSAGITVGTVKGGDIVPAHSLAMSADINAAAFCTADIDYAQAMAYLRRKPLSLPPSTPRGYVLLRFGGHPLGFVKNIGSRANNMYPQAWRIMK